MTLHVFRHLSLPENRESIAATGLEPRNPIEHNHAWFSAASVQPTGVYVTHWDDHTSWWAEGQDDHWRFTYIGPLLQDKLIDAAFVVPEHIPPTEIQLVQAR